MPDAYVIAWGPCCRCWRWWWGMQGPPVSCGPADQASEHRLDVKQILNKYLELIRCFLLGTTRIKSICLRNRSLLKWIPTPRASRALSNQQMHLSIHKYWLRQATLGPYFLLIIFPPSKKVYSFCILPNRIIWKKELQLQLERPNWAAAIAGKVVDLV